MLGVDFMSENVRAILDEAGHTDVAVYRMDAADIGCSLAEAAESPAYEAYLAEAGATPNSLHVGAARWLPERGRAADLKRVLQHRPLWLARVLPRPTCWPRGGEAAPEARPAPPPHAHTRHHMQDANHSTSHPFPVTPQVVYINTSLRTKALAHRDVPTITCTSSNVVQTVLTAFAQVGRGARACKRLVLQEREACVRGLSREAAPSGSDQSVQHAAAPAHPLPLAAPTTPAGARH